MSSPVMPIIQPAVSYGKAFDTVEKTYGIDTVYIFRENAELIAAGKMIYREHRNQ